MKQDVKKAVIENLSNEVKKKEQLRIIFHEEPGMLQSLSDDTFTVQSFDKIDRNLYNFDNFKEIRELMKIKLTTDEMRQE